jgi:hypothetical protein
MIRSGGHDTGLIWYLILDVLVTALRTVHVCLFVCLFACLHVRLFVWRTLETSVCTK